MSHPPTSSVTHSRTRAYRGKIHCQRSHTEGKGWLRLVGPIKLYISVATYNFIDPTNQSHPIASLLHALSRKPLYPFLSCPHCTPLHTHTCGYMYTCTCTHTCTRAHARTPSTHPQPWVFLSPSPPNHTKTERKRWPPCFLHTSFVVLFICGSHNANGWCQIHPLITTTTNQRNIGEASILDPVIVGAIERERLVLMWLQNNCQDAPMG